MTLNTAQTVLIIVDAYIIESKGDDYLSIDYLIIQFNI